MIIKPTICLQTPPTDVSMRCYREGTIDSPEVIDTDLWPLNSQGKLIRKRIALINRKDDTNLLAMVVSKPDKTWEMHTYPECDDGEMCLIGYDDSGIYNAARYDRIALDSKTFTYEGSDVQLLEDPKYLFHKLIVGIDRTIRKSFCNWLVEISYQNLNDNYLLTPTAITSEYLLKNIATGASIDAESVGITAGMFVATQNDATYNIELVDGERIVLNTSVGPTTETPIKNIGAFVNLATYEGTPTPLTTTVPLNLKNQIPVININEVKESEASIHYSISFDEKHTYKVWTGTAWRAIVSDLPAVHGVIGDSDWYYHLADDSWAKSANHNSSVKALGLATAIAENQMPSTVLSTLTEANYNATGGYSASTGNFDLAMTFVSTEVGKGATINSLTIGDDTEQVWLVDLINLDGLASITSSQISWSYPVITGFDFNSSVTVYACTTDTTYTACTNGGSIPGVTAGMTTAGKKLHIKIVADKLDDAATLDPALITIEISIL